MLPTAINHGARAMIVLDPATASNEENDFRNWLSGRLVGQPEAIEGAVRLFRRTLSLRRPRSGVLGVMVGLGPSTTGKTYLAQLLAEYLHGDQEALIALKGGEYMMEYQVGALVGAARGLIGFSDANDEKKKQLADHDKDNYSEISPHNIDKFSRRGSKNPVTVLLIDEWEKGHPDFQNLLLSVIRDGKVTLGNGQVADFRRTVVFFTSNLGARDAEKAGTKLGFTAVSVPSASTLKLAFTQAYNRFALPEFRMRVKERGEVVIFNRLSDAQIASICKIEVARVCREFAEDFFFQVRVDEAARRHLLVETFAGGGDLARLKSVVQKNLVDAIDNEMTKQTVGPLDIVTVTHNPGAPALSFTCLYNAVERAAALDEPCGRILETFRLCLDSQDEAQSGHPGIASDAEGENSEVVRQTRRRTDSSMLLTFEVKYETEDPDQFRQARRAFAHHMQSLEQMELASGVMRDGVPPAHLALVDSLRSDSVPPSQLLIYVGQEAYLNGQPLSIDGKQVPHAFGMKLIVETTVDGIEFMMKKMPHLGVSTVQMDLDTSQTAEG